MMIAKMLPPPLKLIALIHSKNVSKLLIRSRLKMPLTTSVVSTDFAMMKSTLYSHQTECWQICNLFIHVKVTPLQMEMLPMDRKVNVSVFKP